MTVTPRAEGRKLGKAADAKVALAGFVEAARSANPYNVCWSDAIWKTATSESLRRGHLSNNCESLVFSVHPSGKKGKSLNRQAFERGFADLIKACVAKRRADRGVGIGSQRVFLRASRYLYDTLSLPVRRDVTLLSRHHFVQAEDACLAREEPSSAYRVSVALAELAKTLDRYALTRSQIQYRSSVKRPVSGDRTSTSFAVRAARLPNADALDALASLANDERVLSNPIDRLFIRLTELLFVGGFRVGELLTMPKNALVREVDMNTAPGGIVERIGLRYWPEKGGEPIVKWFPQVANELVVRAVNDIDEICGPARENASWLDNHPGTVRLAIDDDARLSTAEVARLLNLNARTAALAWLKSNGCGAVLRRGNGRAVVTGAELKHGIASKRYDKPMLLRRDGKAQSLGESLVVLFLRQADSIKGTNPFISVPVTQQQLAQFLAGRDTTNRHSGKRSRLPSAFERFDARDTEGEYLAFRTHDFRRLLNVYAQRGGLSQVEIARWMGRRRIQDNVAYDLRTGGELAEEMRELILRGEVFGLIADQAKSLPEHERNMYLRLRLAMAHATPLGDCGSNVAEDPCETAVSCLGGCRHYLRRKNDRRSRGSLLRIERETIVALDRARTAHAEGKSNAASWIESYETVLRTARAALAIDDDATLLDGELKAVNPSGPVLGEPMK